MPQKLEIRVACDLAAIAEAQASLRAFAEALRILDRIVYAMELAADEILSNAIRHGFPPGRSDRSIDCSAEISKGHVVLVVRDNGSPFDPLHDAPPPDLRSGAADAPVGGLGVHIVTSMADRASYARVAGRNRLELGWRL